MPYRVTDQNCSIARALAVVGDRWSLLVMREVLLGRHRFADISRMVGAAPNILTDRLQTLVDHGLLERRKYSDHPPAFEYVATRKGLDLNPVLVALTQWGDAYEAPNGPPRVFVHTACGHDAKPRMQCSHCGEPITARALKVRPGRGANERQRADGVLPLSRT